MSKLLSLARLQDQSGRCGTAVTPRPLGCRKRRPSAARSVWPRSRRWQRWLPNPAGWAREPAAMGVNVTIDTRAGACGCVMVW